MTAPVAAAALIAKKGGGTKILIIAVAAVFVLIPALFAGAPVFVVLAMGGPQSTFADACVGAAPAKAPTGTVDGYGPAQLTVASTIITVGQQLGVDQHGQQVAVMVGMGESSLTDLNHGDAVDNTTIGVFQQGASYGTRAQRLDVPTAARAFYTRMLGVSGWQTMTPTLLAHAVQNNADPNHYTLYWAPAGDVLAALSGTADCTTTDTGPVTLDWNGGGGFAPDPTQVQAVLAFAQHQLGKPYVIDGAGPSSWDCSGLTMVAYGQVGITIGTHSVTNQYDTMRDEDRLLPYADAEPGDLLFWYEADGQWEHVGFYLGGGEMLSAAAPGEGVRTEKVWIHADGETLAPVVGRPTGAPQVG